MQVTLDRNWIGLCETQPATAEGIRIHLDRTDDLGCLWSVPHLGIGLQLLRQRPVSLLVLDKAFGHTAISEALAQISSFVPHVPVAVWGSTLSESEALRLVRAGARGLLRKTEALPTVLDCFRSMVRGSLWFGDILSDDSRTAGMRPSLTPRESEILELVQRGWKNRQIADHLGIRPGTVKIHLKHLFEKKGVHGRYGLVLGNLIPKPTNSGAYPDEFVAGNHD